MLRGDDSVEKAASYAAEASAAASGQLNAAIANAQADANALYYKMANKAASLQKTLGRKEALRQVVAELAESGVSSYSYAAKDGSIVRVPVDVGIRRMMHDASKERRLAQTLDIARRTGQNLVEVSVTANARPSHAAWQGKVYQLEGSGRYPNFYEACKVGDKVNGIGGYNCGHTVAIYCEGHPKVYKDPLEGSGYSHEEAAKLFAKQRRYEREIRKQKRIIEVMEHAGFDPSDARKRLREYRLKLLDLVDGSDGLLKRQRDYRENVHPYVRAARGAGGVVSLPANVAKTIEFLKSLEGYGD